MKYQDYVKDVITKYPGLYKTKSYEDSEVLVADHIFGTLGNGLEWANTVYPENAGYIVQPEYAEVQGEWERLLDAPYGLKRADETLYLRTMNETIWRIPTKIQKFGKRWLSVSVSNDKEYFEKDVPLWVKFTKAYRLCRIESTSLWNRPYPPRNIDTNHYPYPNFDKKYSPFWEEGAKYIQEDWRLAGLAYLETCKKFFLTANLKEIDWYKDAAGYDVKALEFIEETKALLESYKR